MQSNATMQSKAARVHAPGAADAVKIEMIDLPEPGAGEVQIRHTAIGFNFQDIYTRGGFYPAPMPTGLGTEAAGVVEKVGTGVTAFKAGDRVCYASGPALGACASHRVFPAARLLKTPEGISDDQAAAILLKGHDQPKDRFQRFLDGALGWIFRPFNRFFEWSSHTSTDMRWVDERYDRAAHNIFT